MKKSATVSRATDGDNAEERGQAGAPSNSSHLAQDPRQTLSISASPTRSQATSQKADNVDYKRWRGSTHGSDDARSESSYRTQPPAYYDGNYAEHVALNMYGYPEIDPSKLAEVENAQDGNHVVEGGRRFAIGNHLLPNDEQERAREEIKHTLTNILFDGKPYLSPVPKLLQNGGKVLDLGTGVGLWPMQMGELFPKACVRGRDIFKVRTKSAAPANVVFDEGDFHGDWPDEENTYDFIFLRHTTIQARLEELLPRVFRHLKPGGYFEIQDYRMFPRCDDGTLTSSTPYGVRDLLSLFYQGVAKLGFDASNIATAQSELFNAGFEKVSGVQRKIPLGPWWPVDEEEGAGAGKSDRMVLMGRMLQNIINDTFWSIGYKPLSKGLGLEDSKIEDVVEKARKDLFDPKFHVYITYDIIYGRKPGGE